jgi:hypothetical protein
MLPAQVELPAGLCVLGDVIDGLNPVHGQGHDCALKY